MKNNNKNVTRQGVRNLDSLPSRSVGIRMQPPPSNAIVCKHPRTSMRNIGDTGDSKCISCGQVWDDDGKAYE